MLTTAISLLPCSSPIQNSWTLSLTNQLLHITSLNWILSPANYLFINTLHGHTRKHRFQQGVLTDLLFRNGLHNPVLLFLRACMLRLLPSNGCCLQSLLNNRAIRRNINTTTFQRPVLVSFPTGISRMSPHDVYQPILCCFFVFCFVFCANVWL
jgi:hypothetical protein